MEQLRTGMSVCALEKLFQHIGEIGSLIVIIVGSVRRAVPNLIQPSCLVRGQDGRFGPSKKTARTTKCPALMGVIKVQQIVRPNDKGRRK